MDRIDRKILDILQKDARAPLKEIADRVFLSSPAVSARMARLESSGAIIGIQMAGAYVGSTFAPPLFGLLGSALSFSILPAYLLVFAVFMIAMTELTFRTAEKNRSDTGP